MKMITYLIDNQMFLDFQTVIKLFGHSRTYTYRVLVDQKIPYVVYKNRKLYSKEEVLEYKKLNDVRQYLNERKPSKEIIDLLLKKKIDDDEKVH